MCRAKPVETEGCGKRVSWAPLSEGRSPSHKKEGGARTDGQLRDLLEQLLAQIHPVAGHVGERGGVRLHGHENGAEGLQQGVEQLELAPELLVGQRPSHSRRTDVGGAFLRDLRWQEGFNNENNRLLPQLPSS